VNDFITSISRRKKSLFIFRKKFLIFQIFSTSLIGEKKFWRSAPSSVQAEKYFENKSQMKMSLRSGDAYLDPCRSDMNGNQLQQLYIVHTQYLLKF